MSNTTPAVSQSMEQTTTLTQCSKPIQLYDSNLVQLGFVLRPVKPIKIPPIFGGNAADQVEVEVKGDDGNPTTTRVPDTSATARAKATKEIERVGKLLRAKLVETAAVEFTTYTDSGPLIRLPLPEKIKDSVRLSYSTADMGVVAAGALFGQDVAEGFKDSTSLANSLAGNASYLIRTLLNGLGAAVGGASQKFAGNIPNPFSAAIFEKVVPRKFNFSWTIQPQDSGESENLRDIINHIRYWSLPNPSADRLILDVPFEWELGFVGTSFLYSFSRCVMTSLDIDYSPNGFNAFMADGAPQSVTITMDFEEIYPLDKSVIEGGPSSMLPSGALANAPENTPEAAATEDAKIANDEAIKSSVAEVKKLREEVAKLTRARDAAEALLETGQDNTTNAGYQLNYDKAQSALDSANANLTAAVQVEQAALLEAQ